MRAHFLRDYDRVHNLFNTLIANGKLFQTPLRRLFNKTVHENDLKKNK